jgi:nitrite reductase/ring-hydroxylating ferredoxin subunit
MADFETVANEGEIPPGEGRAFRVNGRMVAVFLLEDGYHAIADACPHMGASLASGYVEDGGVICPWHAWRFCIRDGTWLDSPKSKVRADCFEVRVVDGAIQVLVPDPRVRPVSTNS